MIVDFTRRLGVYLIIQLSIDGFIAYIRNRNVMDGETPESNRVPSSSESQRFTAALDGLKQAGCVVLVTGVVDETVRAAASRRLFGTPQLPRQRVVVYPGDIALQPASYLPHGITPDSTSVQLCEWDSLTRGESADTEMGNTHEIPTDLVVCSDRLSGIIADLEPTSNEFAPGEIRVGVLTLSTIVEEYGQTATETFLSSFGQRVQRHHGLVHCHLPMESKSTTALALANTVDIHIRLRDQDGNPPEQQWYLCETDCASKWMPLQETE